MEKIKKISRLTGALLAKKGTAAPSSAPSLLNQQVLDHFPPTQNQPDKIALEKPAVKADENIAEEKPAVAVDQQPSSTNMDFATAAENSVTGRRIAMTLRMAREDHLKLRLFSAHTRKSCQAILSEALERYLVENGDKVPILKMASRSR